jgi:hypothetical protein
MVGLFLSLFYVDLIIIIKILTKKTLQSDNNNQKKKKNLNLSCGFYFLPCIRR